jgi:Siphovirus Gp157
MDIAGVTRLPEPDFLARIQAGQPQLAELDLDALPPEYVDIEVTVVRKPLRDRILADLKAGKSVPGASLLRGLPFLVVNRK